MLLRKLVAALCPLLLCMVVCQAFRWLDGLLGSSVFWTFVLKGVLLGIALSLCLPLAGVRAHTNGLAGWLLGGAGLMLLAILYQALEAKGVLRLVVLHALLPANGQVVFAESVVAGYLLTAGLWYRRR